MFRVALPKSALLLAGCSLLCATLVPWSPLAAAEVTGEAVYDYCESCHGRRGAGGEGGKYPRIAGLPAPYVDKQLHDFKNQARINKPMLPIFKHHRFDAEVIAVVADHIAGMSVPDLSLWPYEPEPEALAAFDSKTAYQEAGADLYQDRCAECHGAAGGGVDIMGAPPLIGQYPAYLTKQIGDFAAGSRTHADSERCADLTPAQADAVIWQLVELGK